MKVWSLKDLIVDHSTGKLRETALWSNIGKASMTWAFIYTILKGTGSEWLWLAYGGIVVAHESTARFFNQKELLMNKGKNNA